MFSKGFLNIKKKPFSIYQLNIVIIKSSIYRAVEALTVVIVVKCLYPAVTSFYWEPTREALSREQVIPVCETSKQ